MDHLAPGLHPSDRRDAYQPSDPSAYLMLQRLPCVRHDDKVDTKDILCSLCMEVRLGERLLDNNDDETEYRIAFYALPCGHLRCCSCALKWLDTAGLFHRICQLCDSKKLNVEPDLSSILDSIDYYTELKLPGFSEIKPPNLRAPAKYSPITLPTIDEVEYDRVPNTPSKLDLSTLLLQTPAAKRITLDPDSHILETNAAERRESDLAGPRSLDITRMGIPAPSSYQWTPQAQRTDDVMDMSESEIIPSVLRSPAVVKKKEEKLRAWTSGIKRKSYDLVDDGGDDEDEPTSGGSLEEEKEIRKKPKYAK